jgi:transcriptional regulator with XRE-family HTH domain
VTKDNFYVYTFSMERMEENDVARAFWNRIDSLRGKMQLHELAIASNMSFTTLRNQKSGRTLQLPKTLQAYSMAKTLNTTVEFLLTGNDPNIFSSILVKAYSEASETNKRIVDIALSLDDNKNQTKRMSV